MINNFERWNIFLLFYYGVWQPCRHVRLRKIIWYFAEPFPECGIVCLLNSIQNRNIGKRLRLVILSTVNLNLPASSTDRRSVSLCLIITSGGTGMAIRTRASYTTMKRISSWRMETWLSVLLILIVYRWHLASITFWKRRITWWWVQWHRMLMPSIWRQHSPCKHDTGVLHGLIPIRRIFGITKNPKRQKNSCIRQSSILLVSGTTWM